MTQIRRILLLNPPIDTYSHKLARASFPLGLCYIGTYLQKKGYEVKVIDAYFEEMSKKPLARKNFVRIGMSSEKIAECMLEFVPDVLGISCNFYTHFYPAIDIAKLAKKQCRVPFVVIGGSYASVVPERLMASDAVDYIIIGEGEKAFVQLLESLKGGADINKLGAVDSLVYRDQFNRIQINPKKSFISPEEFFIPNRDFLPVERYIQFRRPYNVLTRRKRVLEVTTSRGCQMKCSFCSSVRLWGSFRPYSAEMVLQELTMLKQKYGIEEVQFLDDNLTADRKRACEIFQAMIDNKLNFAWCAPNGLAIYSLDETLIGLMKQSGCYAAVLALETGSPRVAKELIHKPIPYQKIPALINSFRQNHINIEVFLLVGMPQETLEEIRQTFDYVFDLGIIKAHFNYVIPIPNTPVYAQYLKSKTAQLGPNQVYDWRTELDFDFKMPVMSTPLWSTEELQEFVREQLRKFYLKFFLRKPLVLFHEVTKFILRDPRVFMELAGFYWTFLFKRSHIPQASTTPCRAVSEIVTPK